MARHRRMYFYKGVYHVTTRTSEGLPFVCNLLLRFILFGIIARGKSLHPNVKICAWLFMGNHFHALLVNNGSSLTIPDFMEFVNGEIAKAVNRLRGRRNFRVWATRYKAEQILTADSVIESIVYMFMNPVRASLVNSIRDYPGASTWREFMGSRSKSYQFFGSSLLRKLPLGPISTALSKTIILSYRKDALTRGRKLQTHELTIEPFAWLECFEESKNWNEVDVRARILCELAEAEAAAPVNQVKGTNKTRSSVIGRDKLERQCFFTHYISTNYARRSLCKSTCTVLRDLFRALYKDFCEKCRLCWIQSKHGLLDVDYPPGAFKPGRQSNASLLQFVLQA
jgi:REP element-mobilizing transposase RayT